MKNLNKNSAKPLYLQLADLLIPEIKKIPVGEKFAPERQIAAEYNLGLIVARAALQKLAREGYLNRVVSRGTYVASHRPVKKQARQSYKILLFWPIGRSLPHSEAAQAIISRSSNEGHALDVREIDRSEIIDGKNAGAVISDAARNYDGVIWIDSFTNFYPAAPAKLAAISRKTIFINSYLNHPELTCVLRNNYSAVFDLTAHLLDSGRRRIGFAGDHTGRLFITERYRGYCDALKTRGSELDPRLVHMDLDGLVLNNGAELAENILRDRKILPDAMVCCTDYLAIGLVSRLRERGLRVPEDMAVTGFDNTAMAEQFNPAITSADQGYTAMGVAAMHLLLSQLDGIIEPGIKALVPCPLFFRKSSAKI